MAPQYLGYAVADRRSVKKICISKNRFSKIDNRWTRCRLFLEIGDRRLQTKDPSKPRKVRASALISFPFDGSA